MRQIFEVVILGLPVVSLFAAPVDYARDIRPLLKNKCSTCHGALKQKAELRLDAGKLVHAGAKNGEVIKPGNAKDSELIARVTSADKDDRMPPEGERLSAKQVTLLSEWINAGAKFPAEESIAAKPEEHWSLQPVNRPAVPKVKDTRWPRNSIDHFILAKLEAKGWRPNASAAPMQLLRRAHLDLIGLPPTITDQEVFKKKPNLPKLIESLIARKGYGERYARHWLDVVRYADSNGYERDGAKPQVWRFRDYVIHALNADKPFDQFIIEQLAGDEMDGATTESVLATGFNRLGPWDDEPADFDVDRYDQLDDIVNTTSQAFLGLTMGCARCHDHKFDPLLHKDYYSMVAIFNPLKRPQAGRTEKTRYAAPPTLVTKLKARDKAVLKKKAAIKKIRDDYKIVFLRNNRSNLPADVQLALLIQPTKRNAAQKKLATDNATKIYAEVDATLPEDVHKQIKLHEANIEKLKTGTADVPQGYFLYEPPPTAHSLHITHILKRGNPKTPGDSVTPAVPAVLVKKQPEFPSWRNQHTTRRRLTLARWIASSDNPLTARVIVNRVWQWHFGHGIVRTPNDFGLLGEAPTHPLLLDWLAYWFSHDAKWSLKKLHWLIMTSRTWQMSREPRAAQVATDPDNRFLWRMPYRRIEVEAIRDAMLFTSGQLDRKMFGPPMHPFVPRDALLNHADKESIWPKFNEAAASRRTVYAFVKRSLLVPLLEVLDLCDTTQTSPQRKVTTVPTQALTLFNGNFAIRQANHFAARLTREVGNDLDKQIRLAWQLALCRSPTKNEHEQAKKFVQQENLEQLCRVIFNLNEFVYPD